MIKKNESFIVRYTYLW